MIDLIQMKYLFLYLSKNDSFECICKEECSEIVYDEEDRKFDEDFNKLIECIELQNFQINKIISYLNIKEAHNRKIIFVNKMIYVHIVNKLKEIWPM